MECLILRLLDHEEARRMFESFQTETFEDGKHTARGHAREVKNNLQITAAKERGAEIARTVAAAYERSGAFHSFAFPRRLIPPMISRYEPGMSYGSHVDSAFMGTGKELRTDFASTLFLSPPGSYDGGELVVELPLGAQEIKLDAGEAIIYPADTLHRVAPVTRGFRLAAVTWIQSRVRSAELRGVLRDLDQCAAQSEGPGPSALSALIAKARNNLLRYAADS